MGGRVFLPLWRVLTELQALRLLPLELMTNTWSAIGVPGWTSCAVLYRSHQRIYSPSVS